jgi:hypothetical protein
MSITEALDAIRQIGTVHVAAGKLKLDYPTRMRDSLQPALDVLRANRLEAHSIIDRKTPPGDRDQHHEEQPQVWDEWKAAMLNSLFQLQGVLGKPARITSSTVRHGRLKEGEK